MANKEDSAQLNNINDQLPQGSVYRKIYDDLISSGCPISASYFLHLITIENELVNTDENFKKRISQASCLLAAIVENLKLAERDYNLREDKEFTLKLLLRTTRMTQLQDEAYLWFVKEFYGLLLTGLVVWSDSCLELLSQMRYEYASVLTNYHGGDAYLEEAISQLYTALSACKDTMWYTNDSDRNILFEDVSYLLHETLLRQAKLDGKKNPKKAADYASQAWQVIDQVRSGDWKTPFCIAKLQEVQYKVALKQYDDALWSLDKARCYVLGTKIPSLLCDFHLWQGICFFHMSLGNKALKKFRLCLDISAEHNLRSLRAQTLLYLGKQYALSPQTEKDARECFREAVVLFKELNDIDNEKLGTFLIAKLRAYQIFETFSELIMTASWEKFGYLYDLMQWKQRMLPFWTKDMQMRQHENNYQCLLDENLGEEFNIQKD